MTSICDVVVAEDEKSFDALLHRSALTARFLTAADGWRYATKTERLREAIATSLTRRFGPEGLKEAAFILDDWWPDHTRHTEFNAQAFPQPVFEELRSLLVGEFDEWRIQASVYGNTLDGTTGVGSVLIWADKLIIDRKLFAWMNQSAYTFPTEIQPRSFSLKSDDLESPRYNLMNDPD